MQCIAELGCGKFSFINIISIGFINDNTVSHLHDSSLYALKLVSRTCKLNQQEKIHH